MVNIMIFVLRPYVGIRTRSRSLEISEIPFCHPTVILTEINIKIRGVKRRWQISRKGWMENANTTAWYIEGWRMQLKQGSKISAADTCARLILEERRILKCLNDTWTIQSLKDISEIIFRSYRRVHTVYSLQKYFVPLVSLAWTTNRHNL